MVRRTRIIKTSVQAYRQQLSATSDELAGAKERIAVMAEAIQAGQEREKALQSQLAKLSEPIVTAVNTGVLRLTKKRQKTR